MIDPVLQRPPRGVDGEPAGEALLTLFGGVAYIAHWPEAAREAGATAGFGAGRYGDASWDVP